MGLELWLYCSPMNDDSKHLISELEDEQMSDRESTGVTSIAIDAF